jgi:RNA polymerase sigma-70 factor, ECF subfamily
LAVVSEQWDRGEPSGGFPAPALDGTVDITRDRTLVERCQAGDQAAFGELYTRYRRRLVTFCQRRLQDPHEAEDAAQEAFTRAWRALPDFTGERRFYPWLTVIARNVCTDVSRRRSRLAPMAEVPLPLVDPGEVDVDEAIVAMADAAMAAEALEHVSERHRRVLRLREGSGWSTERLAEHEGMAVPAVETLLWRARQSLKREFAALADAGGRLGVALGFGLAALRRFASRTAARVGHRLPAAQSFSTSLRSPVGLVAGLVLAGGIVGGTVVAVGSSAPKPAPAATTLASSSAAVAGLQGSTSRTAAPATGGTASGATPGTAPASAARTPTTATPGAATTHGNSATGGLPITGTPVTEPTGVAGGLGNALTTVGSTLATGGKVLQTAVTKLGTALPTVAGTATTTLRGVTGAVPSLGSTLTKTGSDLGSTLTAVLDPLGTLHQLFGGSGSTTTTTTAGSSDKTPLSFLP